MTQLKRLRIAHICLASTYTEGMAYQDNLLPAQNRSDGHEVLIVSDCWCVANGKIVEVSPENKILKDGSQLIRIPFAGRLLPRFIRNKVRIAPQLSMLLNNFHPDVILYHGVIGAEMLTVGAYKEKHPTIKLFLDCHEDLHNSGRTLASRILQYKLLTRFFWWRIAHLVDKVLYVSYESRDFLKQMFDMPEEKMEFYPLGGYVQDYLVKEQIRKRVRIELDLSEDDIVFIHAGKLDRSKKTLDVLHAFRSMPDSNYRLLVVGTIDNDINDEASKLIATDSRIKFLGWKSSNELVNLLCASDCYLQPGTQSASLQVAICCGLPVMVYPYSSHKPYLVNNGFFVESSADIAKYLPQFRDPSARRQMSEASLEIGRHLLDYRTLARRLYR